MRQSPVRLPRAVACPRARGRLIACTAIAHLAALTVTVAPARGEPLAPAAWLMHLGRDYPLSAQASATDADARITLLLMQAATRIEPALAEAWYWQSEMHLALDQTNPARTALEQYVRLRPDDVIACLRWIDICEEAVQTSEGRSELYHGLLREGARFSAEVRSDLHRRLAEFHWNRGERAQAEREAEAALALFRQNFTARHLLDTLRQAPATPALQLEWLLAELAVDPADADKAREIAGLLSGIGLPAEARPWLEHAGRIDQLTGTGPAPATRPAASSRPETAPAADLAEIQAMLAAFPTAVLDYPLHPEKYLSLTLEMPSPQMPPGEPWACTVRLKNVGPFSITLGDRHMLTPELLGSISTRGDQERSSGPVLRLPLNRRLRLAPGETVDANWALDVGAIRASMIATPQMAQQVELTSILSPIRLELEDGREAWLPGIGGLKPEPLRFRRTALNATSERVRELARRSQAQAISDRVVATELLAMLLAEHQHLQAGRLRYSVQRIDADAVQRAVLARGADADWQVRARLAECLRWFILDTAATQAATKLLADQHWLVRGLTLRLLADQHREKSRPVLDAAARSDPDAWVRAMAESLQERMPASSTSRPAPQ